MNNKKKEKVTLHKAKFSVRTHNCLCDRRIKYLNDIQNYTPSEVLAFKGFGLTRLREVEIVLDNYGMKLKKEKRDYKTNLNHLAERITGWCVIIALSILGWIVIINVVIILAEHLASNWNYYKFLIIK